MIDHMIRQLNSYWLSRALLSAVELDLFTILHRGVKTPEGLAQAAGISQRGVQLLLPFLLALELVEEERGMLKLTDAGKLLSAKNPENRLGIFLHHLHLWEKWHRLTEALQSGSPVDDTLDTESFILAMAHGKTFPAKDVIGLLPDGKFKKILDVGGGPGTYTQALAQRYTGAKVIILDYEEVLEIARRVMHQDLLAQKRIHFRAGDFRTRHWGNSYDLIWVSNIIHSYGVEDVQVLFSKAYDATKPGGYLAVKDFYLEPDGKGPLFPALFGLNMLVNTDEGRTYRLDEVHNLLADAGWEVQETLPVETHAHIVLARHP